MGRTQSMLGHVWPDSETLKNTFSKNLCKKRETSQFSPPEETQPVPIVCKTYLFMWYEIMSPSYLVFSILLFIHAMRKESDPPFVSSLFVS